MVKFAALDANMPLDWFDFIGIRVPVEESELLIVTDDFLDNYPKDHKNKVALLIEPPLRKPHAYSNVYKNHYDFKNIFTFHKEILDNLPNSSLCYFGGSFVDERDWSIYPKSKLVSMIVSNKRDLPGNRFRFDILNAFEHKLDVYGYYKNPIPHNIYGLKDYMFNICVENSTVDYYYTEKICDCFGTGTIPIYWGTSCVLDLFNPEGILRFENLDELNVILDSLSPELYHSKMNAIKENFERGLSLGFYHKNILNAFAEAGVV